MNNENENERIDQIKSELYSRNAGGTNLKRNDLSRLPKKNLENA